MVGFPNFCLPYKSLAYTGFEALVTIGKIHKRKPDYSFLKTFGYSCFPYLRPFQSTKFQFHTTKCVFLGYNNSHKGYPCLHPNVRIYISRHAVFNENKFPYSKDFPKIGKLSPLAQPPSSLHFPNILENGCNTQEFV